MLEKVGTNGKKALSWFCNPFDKNVLQFWVFRWVKKRVKRLNLGRYTFLYEWL